MAFSHVLDHGGSSKASQAAECAGDQGKFWPMHDLLFENQSALYRSDIDQTLRRLAGDLKLDAAAFDQCLSSGKYAAAVKAVDEAAKASGIRIRPTFVVGERRIQGALPWPQFQAILAEATK